MRSSRRGPGIGGVLAFTLAAELGDVRRFSLPKKLCYTGLCPSGPRHSEQLLGNLAGLEAPAPHSGRSRNCPERRH
jgi:hypothetical protein